MNHPLISVIMSVYNCEKYVSQSIESIINQTYSHFEFIIINDGSTDNSLKIIKNYEKIDSRIILIDQRNIGLTKSLNKGIHIAKGDYIARMDADDISLPERFINFINYYIRNQNVMIYTTPAITIDSFGNSIMKIPRSYFRKNGFNLKMLNYYNSLVHGTLIIRCSLVKKYRYDENYRYCQEFELYHRLKINGYKINYDNSNNSYNLRIHDGQITKNKSQAQIDCYKQILSKYNNVYYEPNFKNKILFLAWDLFLYVETKLTSV